MLRVVLATGDEQTNKRIMQQPNIEVIATPTYLDILPQLAQQHPDIAVVSPFLPATAISAQQAVGALRLQGVRVILLIGSLKPEQIEQDYFPIGVYNLVPNPVTADAILKLFDSPMDFGDAARLLRELPKLEKRIKESQMTQPEKKGGLLPWKKANKQVTQLPEEQGVLQKAPPPQWLIQAKQAKQKSLTEEQEESVAPPVFLNDAPDNKVEIGQETPAPASDPPQLMLQQQEQQQQQPAAEIKEEDQQLSKLPQKKATGQISNDLFSFWGQENPTDNPKPVQPNAQAEEQQQQEPQAISFFTDPLHQPKPGLIVLQKSHVKTQPDIQGTKNPIWAIACLSQRPTGKTFIATNLAATISRRFGPTALVEPADGDAWERLLLTPGETATVHGFPALCIVTPQQLFSLTSKPLFAVFDGILPEGLPVGVVLLINDMDKAHIRSNAKAFEPYRHRLAIRVVNRYVANVLSELEDQRIRMEADVLVLDTPQEAAAQSIGRPVIALTQAAECARNFDTLAQRTREALAAATSSAD